MSDPKHLIEGGAWGGIRGGGTMQSTPGNALDLLT
jgi:hypothetical protein